MNHGGNSMSFRSRFIALFAENSFAKNVTILASGTALAQVLPLLSAPVLTRLFSPEDFGAFSLFLAILLFLLPSFRPSSGYKYHTGYANRSSLLSYRHRPWALPYTPCIAVCPCIAYAYLRRLYRYLKIASYIVKTIRLNK